MRHAAVARRELGVPTAFNFLGPMINPAHVQASAVGVANERMAPLVAGVLAKRGSRGLVFRGNDGLDELTTTGPSRVWEIRNGAVSEEMFDPGDLGIRRATIEELRGGDAAANAAVVRSVLAGGRGSARDAALLNAAAGLVAFDLDAVGPFSERMAAAFRRAEESIESGAAAAVLDRWVALSRS
jgi:anthranilate phosphoribosyltransferase